MFKFYTVYGVCPIVSMLYFKSTCAIGITWLNTTHKRPTSVVTQPAYRSDVKFSVSLYQVIIHRIHYFILDVRRETRFALLCLWIEYTWEGPIPKVTLIARVVHTAYILCIWYRITFCLLTSLVCLVVILLCSTSVWPALFRDKWRWTINATDWVLLPNRTYFQTVVGIVIEADILSGIQMERF
jgi:hypothetical protein